MQHDKRNVYLVTIVSVVAIVFLVTLFINTLGPVDEEPREPEMADATKTPLAEDPSASSAEIKQAQEQTEEPRDKVDANGP